ncbi:MAG: HAD family hydrolase [Chloroflexota bacterium]
MGKRRFEVILFDLGDTLIYFDGDWTEIFFQAHQALLRSLQGLGLSLEPGFIDDYRERLEVYYRERDTEFIEYTALFLLKKTLADWEQTDIPETSLIKALADMYAVTQAHWIPELDALPTLRLLVEQGYRLGLVSNAADDANTQALVDKLGARPFFDVIISSAAIGVRKPNPKIFWKALEQMKTPPSQSVMVGDKLGADILGARHAHIFSIWITRRANTPGNRDHLDTIFPDASAATLAEIPGLLRSI